MSKLRQIYMIRHARGVEENSRLDPSDEITLRESCRAMGGLLNGKMVVILHANTKLSRLTSELIKEELDNPIGGHGKPIEVFLQKAKALTPKTEDVSPKVMREFGQDIKTRSKFLNALFLVGGYDALKRAKLSLVSSLKTIKHLENKEPLELGYAQGYVMDTVMSNILEWRQYSHLIRSGR